MDKNNKKEPDFPLGHMILGILAFPWLAMFFWKYLDFVFDIIFG